MATIYGPDTWGAIQIPLPTPGSPLVPPDTVGAPAGDPCLYYIGTFLKAFLATDANLTAAWTIDGVAPSSQPVTTIVYGRPDDEGYSFTVEQDTTLFLWRESQDLGYIGDLIGKDETVLKILWVLPMGQPQATRARLPFQNALVKAMFDGIELGHTPSWIVAGETDPLALGAPLWAPSTQATEQFTQVVPNPITGMVFTCTVSGETGTTQPTWPTTEGDTVVDGSVTWQNAGPSPAQGSSLYTYAGFAQLHFQSAKRAVVRLKSAQGKSLGPGYPAVETSWYLLERLDFGTANRYPNVASGPLSIDLASEQGGVTSAGIVTGQTLPAPIATSLSPPSGPSAGGTSVTLTGTGFVAGAQVAFGYSAATSVVVNSPTSITCLSPLSTAAYEGPGPVRVVVTNPDGQTTVVTNPDGTTSGSLTFTYD